MLACRKGYLRIVKTLLDHGAKVDHQNRVRQDTLAGIMCRHSLFTLQTTPTFSVTH